MTDSQIDMADCSSRADSVSDPPNRSETPAHPVHPVISA
jgi:hypothetical protein